ncbi:Cytoplasmic dynein 2 heavy chain 1 [Collichthys lucidus]|uniref:Cytoplasmic dynein 2 heavy chain 1 n=1 Tax=Collichthys lucidus TaxID=240159 RepID=A0A4U5V0G2_COLLU|nr:Cytoplasmic dynein 2 heavy chain 1 [Collichthys lucidus]
MPPGSDDARKKFILTTTGNFYGIKPSSSLADGSELNNFLDDGNEFVLSVSRRGNDLHLSNKIEASADSREKVLVFFKLHPTVITEDNLHQSLLVSSMLESPINTLYQAVKQVFAPVLLKDERWRSAFDPKLAGLLSELELGLGSVVRQSGGHPSAKKDRVEEDVLGILTPSDEFQYWADLSESAEKNSVRERATYFTEQFKSIQKEYGGLDGLSMSDAVDLVELSRDTLDDVWRQTDFEPYPETRMVRLMDVIGVEKTCPPSLEGKQALPANPELPCKKVLTLRMVHEKLLRLLPGGKQQALTSDRVFEPFSGLNPLHYNPYTEPLWRAAVAQFERLMAPSEQEVAGRLKSYIADVQDNPQQLLQVFQKHKELIRRPTISKELQSERETLLARLLDYNKGLKTDFESRCHGGPGDKSGPLIGRNLPEVVNKIVWVRQLIHKVEDSVRIAEALLSDLSGFKGFLHFCDDLLEVLRAYEQEQFEDWSRDILSGLGDPKSGISLQASNRVMDLDHVDGRLKIQYSDRLVSLLREVRQLSALGFSIPAKIQQAANTADKFYRQAIVLKQVAHFYNTIDQQMIPSQRPMMLGLALAFEQVIKNPRSQSKESGGKLQITWDNPKELEVYITKLQSSAEKLSTENRKLRKWHTDFIDKVVTLMNVDLLRHQQRWKDGLQDLRTGFATLEAQGFRSDDMRAWRQHWNHQLYKALEHQYQTGLEALNKNLPEIHVDLTFKQGRLQFRPPFEEVRARYYREMKRFISIPNQFKGVSAQGEELIFGVMIDRNASGFLTIFSKAEDLFSRLLAIQHKFKEWVVLGQVDLEKLVEKHLNSVQDWERNFKALKARGKESERLPSQEKVDCITVNCEPVKATIDDLIQRLFDILLLSLRKSIQGHTQAIDSFVSESMETLSTRPESMEEIGAASGKYSQILARKPEILPQFQCAEEKNRLLRAVAGAGLDSLSSLRAKWDKLELVMESHQLMIKEQVEVMRSNAASRIDAYRADLERFKARWDQLKPKDDMLESGDHAALLACLQTIRDKQQEFQELELVRSKLLEDCTYFDLEAPDFSLAEETKRDMEEYSQMWGLYEEWQQGFTEKAQEDWITFRSKTYVFEEFLFTWQERLRKLEQPTAMSVKLQGEVDKYKVLFVIFVTEEQSYTQITQNMVPVLKYVRGEHLSQDHWLDMFRLLGLPRGTTLERLTFNDLLGVANTIIEKALELKDLNSRAQAEVTIREALRELDLWGAAATFNLTEYTDSSRRTLTLIKDWKDIVNQVGDNRCLLQSLKDSPYYHSFQDKVSLWEVRLSDLDEYLLSLNAIQRRWVYLEPIFGRGALPREEARFKRVDEDFRSIMSDIQRDNRVVSLSSRAGIKNSLVTILDQLQRCQKSLNEFLEEKRSAFPRFYFIGDDDLLEILGQATNPTVIQSHLKKLFAGIHSVRFDEQCQHIVAMCSLEGEIVPLRNLIRISSLVEEWLSELSVEMKETLKHLLYECLSAGKKGELDPSRYPSQILCLAEQIQFTEDVERALKEQNLQQLELELMAKLEHYTTVDTSADDNTNTVFSCTESSVLQLKLKALILDIIHNISVVKQLNQAGVTSPDAWAWKKQLRFYMGTDKCCHIHMVDAQFSYTYEYQGNAAKLVHTPLTDKCYLTLTQAMKMGLGGNPYGPAGTGKTESVKALGGLVSTVKSMGRIFVGLVKCGAWGCFDEFNRLEEAVLSAVSMQIQAIQDSLKHHKNRCDLLGKEVELDPNSGVFITLNPAGKGYGGRQKLPDNLKQLFRPVAMSRPDNELIAEVILYSEGFKNGEMLGRKLVAIFNLARELLTPQQHYDWGLRALKTVLKACGSLLQQQRRSQEKDKIQESSLVVQALRLNTMSKLTFADSTRFDALVRDVFSGVNFTDVEDQILMHALEEVYKEARLELIPSQVKQYTMNPKAMPRQQLLGHIDMDTREWADGVLTHSARNVVREPQEVSSWIVCDGDIDPEWIESLNSVLDDNRLLTMPSGERIQFGPNVNFLFETHDLSCASPATISRMGMIFLSDEDIDVDALLKSWLKGQPEECCSNLENWLGDYFQRALDWVLKQNDFVVETSLVGTVFNGLSHLNAVTERGQFIVGLLRGLGGNLNLKTRREFAKELLSWARESPPDIKKPLDTYYDSDRGQLAAYTFQPPEGLTLEQLSHTHTLPVIETPDMQRACSCAMPFLGSDPPKLLWFTAAPRPQSRHVLQKLGQTCMLLSSNTGRVFRPKDCENLVLYLKDINLPKPDKWGTSNLTAFLQQALTYKGFYDENLEWVSLENIQVVASMSTGGAVSSHSLTSRFSSIVRICTIDYPDREQLQTIYSAYLQPVLQHSLGSQASWASTGKTHQLAGSLVQLYEQVKAKFTVDDHSHYLFTPCILTEWVLSLLRYDLTAAQSNVTDSVLEVVAYEARRLFRDRLVASKDLHAFDNILSSIICGDWSSDALDNMTDTLCSVICCAHMRMWYQQCVIFPLHADGFYVTWGASEGAVMAPGQSLPPHGKQLGRLDLADLKQGVVLYSRDNRELDLLLFWEVCDFVSRVDRVLSRPGGSLLLAGCSGVGRHTATSLVSHMHGYTLFTPKITRGYTLKNFSNDLKSVMQLAGLEGQQVVLLLEDYQFVHPAFLEMVNSLLSSGEVPGLYTPEELEPLLSSLKDSASQDGFTGPLYNYFSYRIQQNLHIVLIMDCSNSNFTINCESNPAFYRKCSVQWMEGWSESSMKMIPELLLAKTEGGGDMNEREKATKGINSARSARGDLCRLFLMVHESCKEHGATPSQYMAFLHVYTALYSRKQSQLTTRQQHLQNLKYVKVAFLVQHNVHHMIFLTTQNASDQKTEMEKIKGKMAQEVSKIEERKAKIDDELKEVQPLVDEAKRAVGNIKPEALSEIRSLRMPPDVIRDILEGVLRLMGIFDTSWVSMKSFLAKRGVREDIATFEARNITPEIRQSVEELLNKNKASFDPKNAKRASAAAAPLAAWVKANVQYSHVTERIEPLEKEQAGLLEFQCYTTEAAKLEAEVTKAQDTITAAQQLISQLDGEHTRWNAQSVACPFLIDPSSRATEWLRTHLKEHRLEVINQQDNNFMTSLELAVRFGKTLIIQEMDGVEPVLYPLLRRDLIAQGTRTPFLNKQPIGDKVIDYNEDFRLFMATRNPNPFIPPDAVSVVTEINFTTTRAGLRGQLLALTIQQEKPELETEKTRLLQQEEDKKIQLALLEESLLETLATAQGNILENRELIDSLNQTKASSALIQESLLESHRLQASLDQERDAYLPLAESASKMYFVITDLSKINNMYRFSLASFLRLFQRALQAKKEAENTEARIAALEASLKNMVYEYVCRSLFKADQLMFAMHFVKGMYPELFQESATFPALYQSLCLSDSDLWRSFSQSSQCEQEIPSSFARKISPFQQLLLVQAIRPDRLQSAMAAFATQALGMKELSPPPLNLRRLYTETLEWEPVLIIISPGADPSQELAELATETIGRDNYHEISMGQGQADVALATLRECSRNGDWLCLKNLHLVTTWLPLLEKELNVLHPKAGFRLWLTAEVHPRFPPILLQSSLKITYEAPPGLKKNLLRTYESWTPEQISKGGVLARAQSLFCLAWFHAVCQERRNYIPQGWTKFYEFSLSDLRAGFEIIDRLFEGGKAFQWEFVHGLLESAIYGGRIDNPSDLRILRSYLEQFFSANLLSSSLSAGQRRSRGGTRYFPPQISLPNSCSILDYRSVIENLPEDDRPAFFGLPANIERSSQRIISSQVISQLRVLSRSVATGSKFDRELWSNGLSPILHLWKKLNKGSTLIHQKVASPTEGQGSPVLSFITLEQFNAIRLVQSIHQSLAALSKVIRGTQLLTPEVQKLATALLNQECPLTWQNKWEGPEEPMQYLRAVVTRALAIESWVERAGRHALLSDTLDLAELFHPDTFLNALRQETARSMGCSMDSLVFVSSWRSPIVQAKLQVKVGGLQLEGCGFDGVHLCENQHDSPSVSAVPPCYMAWVPQNSAADSTASEESIWLPLYTSSERVKVVTHICLPCGANPNQWIQTGAALFLKQQ